jgi:MFS superfamily sulfate permease-like transporter
VHNPFSFKLVSSLTVLGGVLTLGGGLGTWVRVAQQETSRSRYEDVDAVMGYADSIGLVLAALGAIAIATAILWGTEKLILKLAPVVVALAVTAIAIWKVPQLDRQADSLVAAGLRELASMESPFFSLHAGRGWGAWMLIAGAVVLLLGAVAGILRETDLRKGSIA